MSAHMTAAYNYLRENKGYVISGMAILGGVGGGTVALYNKHRNEKGTDDDNTSEIAANASENNMSTQNIQNASRGLSSHIEDGLKSYAKGIAEGDPLVIGFTAMILFVTAMLIKYMVNAARTDNPPSSSTGGGRPLTNW